MIQNKRSWAWKWKTNFILFKYLQPKKSLIVVCTSLGSVSPISPAWKAQKCTPVSLLTLPALTVQCKTSRVLGVSAIDGFAHPLTCRFQMTTVHLFHQLAPYHVNSRSQFKNLLRVSYEIRRPILTLAFRKLWLQHIGKILLHIIYGTSTSCSQGFAFWKCRPAFKWS